MLSRFFTSLAVLFALSLNGHGQTRSNATGADASFASAAVEDDATAIMKAVVGLRDSETLRRQIEAKTRQRNNLLQNQKTIEGNLATVSRRAASFEKDYSAQTQALAETIKLFEASSGDDSQWDAAKAKEFLARLEQHSVSLSGLFEDLLFGRADVGYLRLRDIEGEPVLIDNYLSRYIPAEQTKEILDRLKKIGTDRGATAMRSMQSACSSNAMTFFGGIDVDELSTKEKREKIRTSLQQCSALATSFTAASIGAYLKEYAALLKEIVQKIADRAKTIADEIEKNKADLEKHDKVFEDLTKARQTKRLAEANLVIHESAQNVITQTLIAWGVIISLVIFAIIILSWIARWRYDPEKEQSTGIDYVLFLEIMSVFLLTGVILVLGIAGKINQEGLAALIGGISGYVLGRMRNRGEGSGVSDNGTSSKPRKEAIA